MKSRRGEIITLQREFSGSHSVHQSFGFSSRIFLYLNHMYDLRYLSTSPLASCAFIIRVQINFSPFCKVQNLFTKVQERF